MVITEIYISDLKDGVKKMFGLEHTKQEPDLEVVIIDGTHVQLVIIKSTPRIKRL